MLLEFAADCEFSRSLFSLGRLHFPRNIGPFHPPARSSLYKKAKFRRDHLHGIKSQWSTI